MLLDEKEPAPGWLVGICSLTLDSLCSESFFPVLYISGGGAWLLLVFASALPDLGVQADPLFQGWAII